MFSLPAEAAAVTDAAADAAAAPVLRSLVDRPKRLASEDEEDEDEEEADLLAAAAEEAAPAEGGAVGAAAERPTLLLRACRGCRGATTGTAGTAAAVKVEAAGAGFGPSESALEGDTAPTSTATAIVAAAGTTGPIRKAAGAAPLVPPPSVGDTSEDGPDDVEEAVDRGVSDACPSITAATAATESAGVVADTDTDGAGAVEVEWMLLRTCKAACTEAPPSSLLPLVAEEDEDEDAATVAAADPPDDMPADVDE